MARNRSLPDGEHSVNVDSRTPKPIGRRSFLNLAGGAVAATVGAAGANPVSASDGDDVDVVEIDYDRHRRPSDVYRVWTCEEGQASFTGDLAYEGEQALEIALEAGGSCGTNTHFDIAAEFGYQPQEIYDSFMIRLSDDWTMAPDDQCKISRAALSYSAGDGHSGGGLPNGANGWSSGLVIANRGATPNGQYNLASYVYHMDGGRENSGPWETTRITPGRWHRIEQYLKVNSTDGNGAAMNDGVYRVWVDGELGFERTNYRWTTDRTSNAIEYCGPYIRYGGGETAPRNMAAYYDDHTMAFGTDLDLEQLR